MTTITSAVRNALKDQPHRGHIAVRIQFSGYDFKAWSGIGPKTISGQTYIGAGTLGTIAAIADTSTDGLRGLIAERIEMTLSGLPVEPKLLTELVDYQHQGSAVTILAVLLDATDAVVADPVTIFSGQVDTMSYKLDETLSISLTAENFLAYMFRGPDGRRRSDADQQEIFSGDEGFEYNAKQMAVIPWGSPTNMQPVPANVGGILGGIFGLIPFPK